MRGKAKRFHWVATDGAIGGQDFFRSAANSLVIHPAKQARFRRGKKMKKWKVGVH